MASNIPFRRDGQCFSLKFYQQKYDAVTLDLTCKILTHLKNVAFFNGKPLKEKHGGSSRAAKLHGVS